MAAEKLIHSVKGFPDADQHDRYNQLISGAVVLSERFPKEKKDEVSGEGQPFEEFDFRKKGNETE